MELRCKSKKHAELDDSVIEVKCDSRFCGARAGVVVLHRFDASTGELKETLQFKDPARKGSTNASHHSPAAVRSA
jgi:hypothetical protein